MATLYLKLSGIARTCTITAVQNSAYFSGIVLQPNVFLATRDKRCTFSLWFLPSTGLFCCTHRFQYLYPLQFVLHSYIVLYFLVEIVILYDRKERKKLPKRKRNARENSFQR